MLAFTIGLSVATSLAFGLLPALRSLQIAPQGALQLNSARLSGSKQTVRTRGILVAVEVACSVILLIVTGLITRSFSHLITQDRQFNAQHVSIARVHLSGPRFSRGGEMPANPGADPNSLARDAMIDRTLDKLRSLPGAQSVAITSVVPLTGDTEVDGLVRPDRPVPAGHVPMANRRFISPGYLATMQIPLLAGRDFTEADKKNPRVVIVSAKTARTVWPDESPVGHTLQHWGRLYTVIGIAADARIDDLKRDAPVFYLPYWDFPPVTPVFLVRSTQGIDEMGPEMRQAIWSIDPDTSITSVLSLDAQVDESVGTERFQTVILSSFGGAALLLAVIGIYGVIAYSVSLRTQEFGIRIALGSSKARLVRLVLRAASYPVLSGIVVGLLGAAATTRWVSSLLFETSAFDPWAIGSSLALLVVAALTASLLPARNAVSIDPVRVLRGE